MLFSIISLVFNREFPVDFRYLLDYVLVVVISFFLINPLANGYVFLSTAFDGFYVSKKSVLSEYFFIVYGFGLLASIVLTILLELLVGMDRYFYLMLLGMLGMGSYISAINFLFKNTRYDENLSLNSKNNSFSLVSMLSGVLLILVFLVHFYSCKKEIVMCLLAVIDVVMILVSPIVFQKGLIKKINNRKYKLMQGFRGQ